MRNINENVLYCIAVFTELQFNLIKKNILTAFIKANKALEIKPVKGQLELITPSIGQEREYLRYHFSALVLQQWAKWLGLNIHRHRV